MVTIYGKENCGFCTKAKALADQYGIKYEYKDIGRSPADREELFERASVPIKSVPQIFIRKEHVGGFTQFKTYIEETGFTGGADHSL